MFCVECGKDDPIFRDGVCLDCYLKTNSFSKGPEFIDIPVCAHCNSFKYKSSWTSELFGDVLKRMIKNSFNISRELKKIDINTECKEEKERINCKVYISGFIDDVEINEEHNVFVRLKKTVCDVCSKRFGGYHEAIVQIRADKRDLTEGETDEVIAVVENIVQSIVAKGNRSLFVTDMEIEHGGIDFYLSDKGFGQTIVNKIQDKHGGEIKTSSKNVGMKDSKQVYRVTFLLRLPAFRRNDFVSFGDSYFYISSISKNKVHLYELLYLKELQCAQTGMSINSGPLLKLLVFR